MKNSIKTLAVLALVGFAGTASAQNSAFTTGTATGTLIAPIAITQFSGMTLGNTVAGVAGTVGTPGSTAPSYAPAGLKPGSQGGTLADAVFTVTGAANYTFAITTGAATMTGGPGAATGVSLALNTVTGSGTCNPTGLGVGTIPAGGSGTFNVGGVASFIEGDVAGTTNATWTETVAYN